MGYTVSTDLKLSQKSLNLNPAFSLAYPYLKYNTAQPAVVKAAVKTQQKAVKQKGGTTTTPEPFDVVSKCILQKDVPLSDLSQRNILFL